MRDELAPSLQVPSEPNNARVSEPRSRGPRRTEVQAAQGGILTEDYAAERFAERFAGRFRYCHSTGAWFEWDSNIWRRIRTNRVFHDARLLARELARGQEDKVRQAALKTTFSSGVERFARVDPMFAVTIEAWDPDPLLLGTPAGTVDLRTGLLRPSDQAEGITKMTATVGGLLPDRDHTGACARVHLRPWRQRQERVRERADGSAQELCHNGSRRYLHG
jgi:putative DNA primase/helicase